MHALSGPHLFVQLGTVESHTQFGAFHARVSGGLEATSNLRSFEAMRIARMAASLSFPLPVGAVRLPGVTAAAFTWFLFVASMPTASV